MWRTLRLIFTCCHPALAREAQVALTLRAVAGLTTAEIARAFLVPEATLAKRIVRAKRKIVSARIAYRVPGPDDLRPRLNQVRRPPSMRRVSGSGLSIWAFAIRRKGGISLF